MSSSVPEVLKKNPLVFVSYSIGLREDAEPVRRLVAQLQESGIDVAGRLSSDTPQQPWINWATEQIENSDFVLCVCTPTFANQFNGIREGSGPDNYQDIEFVAKWLEQNPTARPKFVVVTYGPPDAQSIPRSLQDRPTIDLYSANSFDRLVQTLRSKLPEEQAPPGETASDNAADEDEESPPRPFGEFRETDFTEYAWLILHVARLLGTGRPRPAACSVRRLLTSIILSGVEEESEEYTGGWLVRRINEPRSNVRRRLIELYPVIARAEGSFSGVSNSNEELAETMTSHLGRVLDLAVQLAKETTGMPVSARHLLGATLSRTTTTRTVDRLLRVFNLKLDDLRARVINEIPKWNPQDDSTRWRRLLGGAVTLPDVNLGPPNYASDSAVGPDMIGIAREVEAMASLISAWAIQPPLSIGLFGEWGSGKSFFMQKLKERVWQIASAARDSKMPQQEFGYYKNIVQVEFNAWHYVEGNLWASLVEHIFSNLRLSNDPTADIDSEANIDKRREKLLEQVKDKTAEALKQTQSATELSEVAKQQKVEAEQTAKDLESEAAAARKAVLAAEKAREDATKAAAEKQRAAVEAAEKRKSFGFQATLKKIIASHDVSIETRKVLGDLGIGDDQLGTAEELRDVLKEASDSSKILSEGVRIFTEDSGRWWLILWLVAPPATIAALVWLAGSLSSNRDQAWMHSIGSIISTATVILGGVIGTWKRYQPKLKPVVDAVEEAKKARGEVEKRIAAEMKKREAEARQTDEDAIAASQEAALQDKKAKEKAAEAERIREEARLKEAQAAQARLNAQSIQAEAERLQQEVEALQPERRIATFIQDRAGAKDYRQHLGVPALVRRDFEKLSQMFQSQRKAEEALHDGDDASVVNRIILYIDDLDRCPPDKVVEVLRAIHLLLAFPLFVVVVAVDARWMKRSLRDRFSLLLNPADRNNGQNSDPASTEHRRNEELTLGLTATPDDYLEKIFQVPFWIRPLNATGCQKLVTALTKDDLESDPIASSTSSASQSSTGTATPPGAPLSANPASPQTAASNPAPEPSSSSSSSGQGGAAQDNDERTFRKVERRPQSLKLSKEEGQYMVELASVIGRSPRSVKRFVNCYRLLKTALDQTELAQITRDGTFRTPMLLLGMVTGLPEMAPELLENLRSASTTLTPVAWAHQVAKHLNLEDRSRWEPLLATLTRLHETHQVATIRPLIDAASLVDRFSFSPIRSDITAA